MRSLLRLLGSTRQLTPYYVGILLSSVLITATALSVPFIIKAATDRIVEVVGSGGHTGADVRAILWLAVALLAVDLTNTLVSNVGGYWGDLAAARMRRILSSRYYEKLLALPQRYFDTELTGTIINRLSRNIAETTQFLNAFANNFLPTLMTTLAVLVISAWYSWPLALLLITIFPLYLWLTALTSTRWQKLEGEKNTQYDIAGGRFAEVIGQIKVVKSFGREESELRAFDERYARTIRTTHHQSRYWHGMDALRRGALNVVFFGVYAIIFVQTVRHVFSVGEMVLLIQLVNLARQPVTMMSYLIDSAQRAIAGSKDYWTVMEEVPEQVALEAPRSGGAADGSPMAAPSGSAPVPPDVPAVEFVDARFGYVEDPDVLQDVDLTIRQGERVALVGESGGGKTTLISLLLGLYRLREGELRVLGQDTQRMSLAELRSRFGVVFQDASLFSGTVRENIAYGHPEATDAEVEAVARRANAHAFIQRFEDGYETVVGERGLKLSGGQKQRIAIARALLKDAPILVLDEATSALDTRSERAVQAGLAELMEGRTSIIIAHRLSTISTVDRIITLKDGRIDEVGTPAELSRTGGLYAQLLELQESGEAAHRKRLRELDISG
ncbi:ATP-binding cassette, subfamily B [Kytococcus aerolatus]|uniref:ATP-binding cassette, subfamily B n=1 Tax=Kytococcus aerolatus TaxID=592308 RepID=A0A212U4Y5_9MICO|nr:ABC transporter ATP-binding protein [Kytococcus aerolatus]SNC73318.1 ATP-binding cassette, subfamily B [Kytococcus aerolatus]